jgi:hypothetical protein
MDRNDRLKNLHSPTNRKIKSKMRLVWHGRDETCRLYTVFGGEPDGMKLRKRRSFV